MRYLAGQYRLLKDRHVLISLSSTTGQETISSCTAIWTFSSSFSKSNSGACTPSITSPWSAYFSCHSLRNGRVRRQFTHVYVQKSTRTTLPSLVSCDIVVGSLFIHASISLTSKFDAALDGVLVGADGVDVGKVSDVGVFCSDTVSGVVAGCCVSGVLSLPHDADTKVSVVAAIAAISIRAIVRVVNLICLCCSIRRVMFCTSAVGFQR